MVTTGVNPTKLLQDVSEAIQSNGDLIRLKYYSSTYSGAQPDEEYITQSGADVWVYGLIQPTSLSRAGEDYKYLEQGKITLDDRKVYITGSVSVSGGKIKFGVGSPVRAEFFALNAGRIAWPFGLGGSIIYTKSYLRQLTNGSFLGEY